MGRPGLDSGTLGFRGNFRRLVLIALVADVMDFREARCRVSVATMP
jgi:hypothetical protein